MLKAAPSAPSNSTIFWAPAMRADSAPQRPARWRVLVDLAKNPFAWLALLFVALMFFMPLAEPLLRILFPGIAHPVYSRASFFALTIAHFYLTATSSLAAAAIGMATAIFVTRPAGREFLGLAGAIAAIGQTFPPVAVLALAVPWLGYGAAPTLAALVLYSILPILETSIAGLSNVPESVRDAARGMGFSAAGLFFAVELPLALPLMLAGLRTAVIINIGTATIGSTVGALTLGTPIVEGLAAANEAYVVEGALVVGLFAILTDRLFEVAERACRARMGNNAG
jgi:osmoprotectant transport system permease protein